MGLESSVNTFVHCTYTIDNVAAVPILRIDLSSPEPAYRQIANGLRAFLVGGRVAPGDRLPPVRQLAVDLAVHHNTVAEAYRQLAQEGWLELVRGRGAVVLERRRPAASESSRREVLQRLGELLAAAEGEGVEPIWLAERLEELASEVRSRAGTNDDGQGMAAKALEAE